MKLRWPRSKALLTQLLVTCNIETLSSAFPYYIQATSFGAGWVRAQEWG